MFTFQPKRKIGGLAEELSSDPAAKKLPFVGSVSNSELIQLLSGSTPDAPDSPNTGSSQNTFGVPAGLKAKYEQRSGVSMDDVSVHYNSDKPIQYGALAYTQGNDVYLGPGQEQHLGHELGHVIQQKQGRVPVTGSVGGAPLNDDPLLEHEADSLLSGNSPVQHITAGHHPDSSAPIQRLRINLAGDNKDSESPEIQRIALFPITTGGERLQIPNGDHEKVKETIAACKHTLGVNEDIVFEGHGRVRNDDSTTIGSVQKFSTEELARMAAKIPKPENWRGKIILFACSAGHLASEVAEEYYKITGKSVTVVGPKEQIISVPNSLDPLHPAFGFLDSEGEKKLRADPNAQFFREMRAIIQYSLWNHFRFLLHTLTSLSVEPKQKVLAILEFVKFHFIPSLQKIKDMEKRIPDGFWERYPNLNRNLRMFYDELKLLWRALFPFVDNLSLSKSDNQTIDSQIIQLLNAIKQMQIYDPYKKICYENYQDLISIFKSYLDFDDKEMMVSATYTPKNKDIEPPASKRSPSFSDHS